VAWVEEGTLANGYSAVVVSKGIVVLSPAIILGSIII
jgi:hypothetical protein